MRGSKVLFTLFGVVALWLPGCASAETLALTRAPGPRTPSDIHAEIGEPVLQPIDRPAVLTLGPPDADWSDLGLPIELPLSRGFGRNARGIHGGDDATCLTQAVYYEARSEGLEGEQAVAQVVMNRASDSRYPGSVCGVVFQRAAGDRGTCQFTFACDGSMSRVIEPQAWATARSVAERALQGFVFEPIKNATHYHADYVAPTWSFELPRIRKIGRHIFYE